MKKKVSILLTILCVGAVLIKAQEATDADLQSARKEQSRHSPPVPETAIPDLSQVDQIFKQTSLGKEADEQRLHIEWRELANRVVNNPDIAAAKAAAESARTDLEKRQRLRAYYDLYYGRMRSLASSPEMKSALDQLRMAHLSQTSQPRVRAVEDSSLPTPTPTPKHKTKKGEKFRQFQG